MNLLDRIYELVQLCGIKDFGEKIGADSVDIKVSNLISLVRKGDLSYDQISNRLGYKPNSLAFKRLLYRAEELLLESLVNFTNQHGTTNDQRNKFSYMSEFIQLRFFEEIGRSDLLIYYSKRLLRRISNESLEELRLLISERLIFHYSVYGFDKNQVDFYQSIYDETIQKIELKQALSKSYYKLVQYIITPIIGDIERDLDNIKSDLDNQFEHIDSYKSYMLCSRLLSSLFFYHLLKRDHSSMIKISNHSITYFRANYPNRAYEIYMFKLRLGVAYIYAGEYQLARKEIMKCVELEPRRGSLHWNSTYTYYFTLEMLTANYQVAADIHMRMVTSKEINDLVDMWLQQWRIRSAYIHFLAKIDLVDLSQMGRRRVPNFKLGRFLNDVPLYAKDKRGLNISILIAQVLILLADRQWDKIYDRMEALNKYSYRHLKNDNTLRSNSFIRMLLSLAKAEFNPVRASRYAEKYVERLKTTSMNLNEYSTEIEIIPYEDLWDIILDLVKGKKRVPKRPV